MSIASARSLFSDHCDPQEYIPRRATEDIIRNLTSLVREGEPAIVLRGPAGIGKSMLLQILAERLSDERRVAYVSVSSTPEPELCHRVLEFLDEPAADDPVGALISAAQLAADGHRRLLLLIDHAEKTPIASSQQLVRAAASAAPHLTVIFAVRDGEGADDFIQALEAKLCGILVAFDRAMNEAESLDYLRRTLARGELPEDLRSRLDTPTLAWIIQGSKGLPGEINRWALDLFDRYERGENPLVPESPKQKVAEPASEPTGAASSPLARTMSLGGMLLGPRKTAEYDLNIDLNFVPNMGSTPIKSSPTPPAAKRDGDPVALPKGVKPGPVPRVQPRSGRLKIPALGHRPLLLTFGFVTILGVVIALGYLASQLPDLAPADPAAGPSLEPPIAVPGVAELPDAEPPVILARTVETPPAVVEPPTPEENTAATPEVEDSQVPEPQELKLPALTPAPQPDTAKVQSAQPEPPLAKTELPERQELSLAEADLLLTSTFDNLYGSDQIQTVTFYALQDDVELPVETLRLARKHISDRIHTLGFLTGVGQLPEIRILSIESGSSQDERYAYLPGEQKALRLSGDDALDPFEGTHFSYEDFRPRSLKSFRVAKLEQSTLGYEPVYVITALPLFEADYDTVELFVGWEDQALLEQRYFRSGQEQPYRSIGHPREYMETVRGSILPNRVIVNNFDSGTTALARIQYSRTADDLDDSLFTLSSFEAQDFRFPSP